MAEEECFNCADPASEHYTLFLDTGKVLEEKPLCDQCISAFREEDWMDVYDEPVLMRGGAACEE